MCIQKLYPDIRTKCDRGRTLIDAMCILENQSSVVELHEAAMPEVLPATLPAKRVQGVSNHYKWQHVPERELSFFRRSLVGGVSGE